MRKPLAGRVVGVGTIVLAGLAGTGSARAVLVQHCHWGVGAQAPTVWPLSTQVMMMPVVASLNGTPASQVAFISFQNSPSLRGVLRVVDRNCQEIARFPDPSCAATLPPGCPANLFTIPRLAPASGLAAGNLDVNPNVEIVGVLDSTTPTNSQLIAFTLAGGCLTPKWCSAPLPSGDFITGTSAPAIAQLDALGTAGALRNEVVIDNKVYSWNGTLRFSGGAAGPRSRTALVASANPGIKLPQLITGRGLYKSSSPTTWTGTLAWTSPPVTNSPLDYSAVAELDPSSAGPEIVVVDTLATTLRVLKSSGVQITSIPIPNPGHSQCGGPPMLGDADGVPGPEIGVSSCSRYTVFKYNAGTLTALWSAPIFDPSGQTTSTLVNTPAGPRIYYADAIDLWVFNGNNGNVLQMIAIGSGTAIEGPVVATLAGPNQPAELVVGANTFGGSGSQTGLFVFDDPLLGTARGIWNQHTYHVTNVTSSQGTIPPLEAPSWMAPARNSYRVQQP